MASALNQPLKWHGGKNYLARRIVSLMPPHLNYVEPYFGGGAVLFARDPEAEDLWYPGHRGVSEVVNDLNRDLTNFWRVLQHGPSFEAFRRRAEATPFSGIEFDRAEQFLADRPSGSDFGAVDVDRAWAFFVAARQSLAGRMRGYTGITKTRTRAGMNNEVSAWISCVAGLPQVHRRLRRVLILQSTPALAVIRKFDVAGTLQYLDPPYLHETRASVGVYEHEMTEQDHRALLGTITDLRHARVILSGYASPLYEGHLSGWRREAIDVVNQASGAREKEIKTEMLWMNW